MQDATTLARQWQPAARPRRARARSPRRLVAMLERGLDAAAAAITSRAEGSLVASPGVEWFLDNEFIARDALRQVAESLPPEFFAQLPGLSRRHSSRGEPRVLTVARAILANAEDRFDVDTCVAYLTEFQRIAPLTTGEIWALGAALRVAALEGLIAGATALTSAELPSDDANVASTTQDSDRRIAASMTTLRRLQACDWTVVFRRASLVEDALLRDPCGIYAGMDESSRDRYRKAVERLAAGSGLREEDVAQRAVAFAEHAIVAGEPVRHVGGALVGLATRAFERSIGYRRPFAQALVAVLRPMRLPVYLSSILAVTGLLVAGTEIALWRLGAHAWVEGLVGLLACVPASAIAVEIVNRLVVALTTPRVLPKMDFSNGIPQEFRTAVVIPCMLSSRATLHALVANMETNYLGNSDQALSFGLLTDVPDADAAVTPNDASVVEEARALVDQLNAAYGSELSQPFFLLHRARRWNETEGVWMGWERKRGKLEEFNRRLRGESGTAFETCAGAVPAPGSVRFVITLDADTELPARSAARLVGTLAHPLNRAIADPASGRVMAGYTVVQPRIATDPASATRTTFSRVYSGDSTLDIYSHAVSDVYQDLFGEGIYAGKGVYDLEAFHHSLDSRVPENALLSHDLFEGIHGRAALATDIVLFDGFPSTFVGWLKRHARWVRGDWQLLPWLGRRVPGEGGEARPNPLSVLARWKILDNLRRSLHSPCVLGLLVLGWMAVPAPPFAWTAAVVLAWILPALVALAGVAVAGARRLRHLANLRFAARNALAPFPRAGLGLVFLPCEAVAVTTAIVRTLVRLFVRRRRMLEWVTSDAGEGPARSGIPWATLRATAAAPATAVVVLFALCAFRQEAVPAASPLLLGWLAAPLVASFTGRPRTARPARLSVEESSRLHRLARRTFHFFETFVCPEERWLPPDNFQESPATGVAHRTSPTNVGFSLLSLLAGYDLGYLSRAGLVARIRNTLDTLRGMETYRGHFLNWYSTRDLTALVPRYVSTVDSGNLAACLIILAEGLGDVARAPVLRSRRREGLRDTVIVLLGVVERLPQAAPPMAALGRHLESLLRRIDGDFTPAFWVDFIAEVSSKWLQETDARVRAAAEALTDDAEPEDVDEFGRWVERVVHHMSVLVRDAETLCPWLLPASRIPALLAAAEPRRAEVWRSIHQLAMEPMGLDAASERATALGALLDRLDGEPNQLEEAAASADRERTLVDELRRSLEQGMKSATEFVAESRALSRTAEALALGMDFSFLFDPTRSLMRIGHDVTKGEPDPSYYDLLASEARVASYFAIAKGDAPPSHWMHLGRPFTRVGSRQALLSWGATMFEHLMPVLLMRHPSGTLLEESARAAVERQIAWASERRVPFGVSESGFHAFDPSGSYQYRAFGVPGLGLRRDLGEDCVIAPYATMLALPFAPHEVLDALERFEGMGMLGSFGIYEAVDFTTSRAPPAGAIVKSYMAHHQGMSLLSIASRLDDGRMVARFHRNRRMATIEHFLHEGVNGASIPEPIRAARRVAVSAQAAAVVEWAAPVGEVLPEVNLLGNGRYQVLLSNRGGGTSTFDGVALTQGAWDPTADEGGSWIYVRDDVSGEFWSATTSPAGGRGAGSTVTFAPHRAEFQRAEQGIRSRVEVSVSADDDVEIRRVRITNETGVDRRVVVASCAEVVLAAPAEARRHPAFAKLFVECDLRSAAPILLFRRRPRSSADRRLCFGHGAHVIAGDGRVEIAATSRDRFLGRGGTWRRPAAMVTGELPGAGDRAPIDPVAALAVRLDLPAYESAEIVFVWAASPSAAQVRRLIGRFTVSDAASWATTSAHARAERMIRGAGFATDELPFANRLLSAVLNAHRSVRGPLAAIESDLPAQPDLWPLAISGDLPILLVKVAAAESAPCVAFCLRAQAYWWSAGARVDLVVLDDRPGGYGQPFRDWLHRHTAALAPEPDASRGVFFVDSGRAGSATVRALEHAASVVIPAATADLDALLRSARSPVALLPAFVPTSRVAPTPSVVAPLERPRDLLFDNGIGGFSPDGRDYVIHLPPGVRTPAPWVNVIGNPQFGCLVSDSGIGCVHGINSSEHRITPWRNDAVTDSPSVAVYLRDEENADVWSPMPEPAPAGQPYQVSHRAGESEYRLHSHGLRQQVDVFVAPDAPVLVILLHVDNPGDRARRLTATCFTEWVLGTSRTLTRRHILTAYSDGVLLARNPFAADYRERVAFLASDRAPHGVTCDRAEFLGYGGDLSRPDGLQRCGLTGAEHAAADPAAAYQVAVELSPRTGLEFCFILGEGSDKASALELAARFRDLRMVHHTREAVRERWDDLCERIVVRTPDPAMDLLVNRWLPYQIVTCRLWARSSHHQPGGAFGFRDQLQDGLGLCLHDPSFARERILDAARHQFVDGDVLHWWHPPTSRGVRTRCSDDMLWLPWVVSEYLQTTGDATLLDAPVTWLTGARLEPDERDRVDVFTVVEKATPLFDHCVAAIERGSALGSRGLPLMGTGDWNDGMDRIGDRGIGESIWLGWFLHDVLRRFAAIAERRGNLGRAEAWRDRAGRLSQSLDAHGWDGAWWSRAFDDQGNPVGSAGARECRIDLVAQAWSVMASGAARSDRAVTALQSATDRLVRDESRLVLLLDPPFDNAPQHPGYIRGYLPGVRENGGQYSHAATWLGWAWSLLGDAAQTLRVFQFLNPILRAATPKDVARYRIEPYVIAGDIMSQPPNVGRGGWSWYTGAAGWTLRLAVERILGLRRRGDTFEIAPCIPSAWPAFIISWRTGGASYDIEVFNDGGGMEVVEARLDGILVPSTAIPIVSDGRRHALVVHLTAAQSPRAPEASAVGDGGGPRS